MSFDASAAVERLWARDASLWSWSGRELVAGLARRGRAHAPADRGASASSWRGVADDGLENVVLLGMGGSSLAPEVMRRLAGVDVVPRARLDPPRKRYVSSARDARRRANPVRDRLEIGYDDRNTISPRLLLGQDGWQRRAVRCDHRSGQRRSKRSRPSEGFVLCFAGEAEVGGRYSALSAFGLVPAALMGLDLEAIVGGALAMAEACRRP